MTASIPCEAGCGRTHGPGKLLCPTCWREVPGHLQRDVYRTWRAYQKSHREGSFGDPATHTARRVAREAYRAARDAALGSIR